MKIMDEFNNTLAQGFKLIRTDLALRGNGLFNIFGLDLKCEEK